MTPVMDTVLALPTFLSAKVADVLPLVKVRTSPDTMSPEEPVTVAISLPSYVLVVTAKLAVKLFAVTSAAVVANVELKL